MNKDPTQKRIKINRDIFINHLKQMRYFHCGYTIKEFVDFELDSVYIDLLVRIFGKKYGYLHYIPGKLLINFILKYDKTIDFAMENRLFGWEGMYSHKFNNMNFIFKLLFIRKKHIICRY